MSSEQKLIVEKEEIKDLKDELKDYQEVRKIYIVYYIVKIY